MKTKANRGRMIPWLAMGCLFVVRPATAMGLQDGSNPQSAPAAAPSAVVQSLQLRVKKLEHEVQALQQQLRQQRQAAPSPAPPSTPVSSAQVSVPAAGTAPAPPPETSSTTRALLPAGTTINVLLDGYYSYNFNRPFNRINSLREFDQTDNGFSLSQAALVLERTPDAAVGRRFGARLDLQFGQAAETLQGNSANEPRPQVYRNIYQAYGAYIVPLGQGLTVDFGKWASPIGEEGAYSKDQINQSRSFLYTFLPAYHEGFRATDPATSWLNVSGWLVNGLNQTEDFNGFKSEAVELLIHPSSKFSWTLNYYTGDENRQPAPTAGPGSAPVQPATPDGREHIADTYATWAPSRRLTLSSEWDYVITRTFSGSAPQHLFGTAAYLRGQLAPHWAVGARAEYLADPGGLFSGVSQDLKEVTANLDFKPADGFMLRGEWRRDFSNQLFFSTHSPGQLAGEQTTLSGALIWWFGEKAGAW